MNKILDSTNNILYILFGFILALFSAWSWQLLPNSIIEVFDSNRKAQLIVLFLLVMFTINLFNPETPFATTVCKSIVVFFLYLAISKQSLKSFVIMMVCLVVNAVISNYIESYKLKLQKAKYPREKSDIKNKITQLTKVLNVSLIVTIVVIVQGVGKYLVKQYKDHYTKNDSLVKFILKFLFEGSKVQRKTTGDIF